MPLHVQSQVVRPGEGPVAEVALEGPVPGVLAIVTGELVGASELPAAAFPVAVVGLLTCRRNHRERDSARHSHGRAASHARQPSQFISASPFICYQALLQYDPSAFKPNKTALAIPLLTCTRSESLSRKGVGSPEKSFALYMHRRTLGHYSSDHLS